MAEQKKQELEQELEMKGLTPEDLENLSEEERAELLKGSQTAEPEKEKKPPQEDERDRQIKGMLADLQRERAEKRDMRDQLEELKTQGKETEALLKEMKEGKAPEDLGISEEDYLNLKQARTLLNREVIRIQKELFKQVTPAIQSLESRLLSISEKEVKDRYSAKNVGAELAYDKVISDGLQELIKDNPEYGQVIRRSPNPAEEAYRIGLTHSKFQELLKKRSQQELVDKLSKGKPKTGVGGAGFAGIKSMEGASVDDLLKLSDDELNKLAKGKE